LAWGYVRLLFRIYHWIRDIRALWIYCILIVVIQSWYLYRRTYINSLRYENINTQLSLKPERRVLYFALSKYPEKKLCYIVFVVRFRFNSSNLYLWKNFFFFFSHLKDSFTIHFHNRRGDYVYFIVLKIKLLFCYSFILYIFICYADST
jgi:hypothetical protein